MFRLWRFDRTPGSAIVGRWPRIVYFEDETHLLDQTDPQEADIASLASFWASGQVVNNIIHVDYKMLRWYMILIE